VINQVGHITLLAHDRLRLTRLHGVKINMYNEGCRNEMFRCLRSRPEFQRTVPAYRVFYGRQARIFLVRESGELRIPIVDRNATAGAALPDARTRRRYRHPSGQRCRL
jgi:hypothetical protein